MDIKAHLKSQLVKVLRDVLRPLVQNGVEYSVLVQAAEGIDPSITREDLDEILSEFRIPIQIKRKHASHPSGVRTRLRVKSKNALSQALRPLINQDKDFSELFLKARKVDPTITEKALRKLLSDPGFTSFRKKRKPN